VVVIDSLIELVDRLIKKELVCVPVYQQETTDKCWSLLGDSIGNPFISSCICSGIALPLQALIQILE
jgi:hypothetical protein